MCYLIFTSFCPKAISDGHFGGSVVLGLMCIKDMDSEALCAADMPFSTTSAAGHEITLSSKSTKILPENCNDYIRLALAYR